MLHCMKRITIAVEDDALYRAIKMEAARQGRSVKDVVSEALERWVQEGRRLSVADRQRRLQALQAAKRFTASQKFYEGDSARDIEELRLERS